MKTALVRRAAASVPLTGQADAGPWSQAEPLTIDQFPWYQGGLRQSTVARLLYDDRSLYVQFLCEDRHIASQVTSLNGPVYQDSCVELFVIPDPQGEQYVNLEINACGTILVGVGAGRPGRGHVTAEQAQRVRVATSVPGPTKQESPDDRTWWASAALPLDLLAELTGQPVRAASGSLWRANLYRCGGRTDPQYATWNPVTAPQPDYHRPECFGTLRLE